MIAMRNMNGILMKLDMTNYKVIHIFLHKMIMAFGNSMNGNNGLKNIVFPQPLL